jgi:DNA polymerase-3 subunit epsilon
MSSHRVAPDAALHELEYVVVDLETTGGSYTRDHRVTEVAVVLVRDGKAVDTFSSLVNPCRAIPAGVARLTGISEAMVAEAPLFRDVADQVRDLVARRVFVAHNAGFDWAFLTEELARATGERLAGEKLCTVKLARRLLGHLPRRNLDAVSAHYGIRNAARHRAWGDAEATAKVFERMLDELGRQGIHTWRELNVLLKGKKKKPKRTALPRFMTDWSIA